MKIVERICTFAGVLGLAAVGFAYLDAAIGSHSAVAAFEQAAGGRAQQAPTANQALWSDNAKVKYRKAQAQAHDAPVALLEIEKLGLKVPVFVGTNRLTLNRGAGIVDGTAFPGENGNMVISAHRDSYFRSLKDIAVDDRIVLKTADGPEHFRVADISITDPLDVSVLDETPTSTLTLITCYPFYYVGYAAERYIVRAVPADADNPTSEPTVAQATSAVRNHRANAETFGRRIRHDT